jgi:hypothetical protein
MYSVLLDNAFLKYNPIDFYVGNEIGLSPNTFSPVVENCLNLLKEPGSMPSVSYKSIVEFVNQLIHINDYNNLSLLLDLVYNKKYFDFCKLFYSPLHNKNLSPSLVHCESSISINLLYNMVFIVEDKELFINNIRERGYNVNEGPQQ